MSAPTKQRTARRPAQPQGSRVTRYVDHQLEKTRRQVKSNDLVASILLLVVMVIGFLLLAAIVDAWVFTLTPLMRWAALLLLVTGSVVMMVFSIWPLLTKKINPDYVVSAREGFSSVPPLRPTRASMRPSRVITTAAASGALARSRARST